MTKLMEQSEHFVVGQERRRVLAPGGKVGDHVGLGVLHRITQASATEDAVHPSASPLALSSKEVAGEVAHQLSLPTHGKALEIAVIGGGFGFPGQFNGKDGA